MSSGWARCSLFEAPVPFTWKVWCSTVPKRICLTVNEVGAALALALGEPVLGLELELELLLELEHPAVASRPAATTEAPSLEAVRNLRRLRLVMERLVCQLGNV
jgi:hypothetical protein